MFHARQTFAPQRLPLLDGLRGIAALCVLGYHTQNVFQVHGPFGRSYLFVDFFFLLSGFVLGLVAEPRLLAGLRWNGFMVSRMRRLWPMIAIGAILGTVWFATYNDLQTTICALALALLMVPTLFHPPETFPLNGPQWSLFMELLANLAHGLVLWKLSTRVLIAIVGLAGLLLLIERYRTGASSFQPDDFDWSLALARVGFSYTLGLVFARWRRSAYSQPKGCDWRAPVLTIVGIVFALPFLPLSHWLGDCLVTLVAFPLTFAWASTAQVPGELTPAFLWLGRLSYPLYSIHVPVSALVVLLGPSQFSFPMALLGSITMAWGLAALFERPQRSRPAARKVAAAT